MIKPQSTIFAIIVIILLLIESNGYKISESPCRNVVNLYRESAIKPFRGSPYRWMPDEANHLWFIPKKKAII